jgi:protein-disulfide isomerase
MSEGSGAGERRRRLLQLASAAVFLAIAAVAVAIVVSGTQTDGGDPELEGVAEVERELRGIPQSGLGLGDPAAEVTLAEFGDLQCPACKVFAEEIIPPLIESRIGSGEARLVFRNFTILGPESEEAAAAAVAAGMQDRGWSFVALFYRNQGFEHSGYVTDEFLTAVAEGAGVADIGRWNRDRRSRRVSSQVGRDNAEAERLGFDSTPSFAVEGPATDGPEPISVSGVGDLEAAVDGAR